MNKIYFILIVLLLTMLLLLAVVPSIPRNILFWVIEGLGVLTLVFLVYFYRRVMRPMRVIGNGMELLREQDFSSRLRKVGEPEVDRIVETFNRMMTELKNSRLRLRERNHLLDLLVEVSPMGVVMLDFDSRIVSLNPAAVQLLDCQEAACVGKTFAQLPQDLARKISQLKDGQTAAFNMSNAHIYRCTRQSFFDQGFPHPFVLIESLTQDVMKAEREAYGKVIRMISHEVNNTMASVGSIMETVGDALHDMSEETTDLEDALQACGSRSREMSQFITRFADVVKIPAPVLKPTQLNSLVTANQRFLESLCSAKGVLFSVNLCATSPIVGIDIALMGQVLVNIVKNSVESIADAATSAGLISITTTATPYPQLIVSDNGVGISPDIEANLFAPFFSTKPNGHGIGLLLIREILTQHHCRFSLKTGSDGITRFTISFSDYQKV